MHLLPVSHRPTFCLDSARHLRSSWGFGFAARCVESCGRRRRFVSRQPVCNRLCLHRLSLPDGHGRASPSPGRPQVPGVCRCRGASGAAAAAAASAHWHRRGLGWLQEQPGGRATGRAGGLAGPCGYRRPGLYEWPLRGVAAADDGGPSASGVGELWPCCVCVEAPPPRPETPLGGKGRGADLGRGQPRAEGGTVAPACVSQRPDGSGENACSLGWRWLRVRDWVTAELSSGSGRLSPCGTDVPSVQRRRGWGRPAGLGVTPRRGLRAAEDQRAPRCRLSPAMCVHACVCGHVCARV